MNLDECRLGNSRNGVVVTRSAFHKCHTRHFSGLPCHALARTEHARRSHPALSPASPRSPPPLLCLPAHTGADGFVF